MKLFYSLLAICFTINIAKADTLTISMDTVISPITSQVEISIKANGFTNLAVFEGSIEWDTLKLDFVEVKDFGIDNLAPENFGRPNGKKDKLTFSWTEASNEGKSAPDGTTLFKIVFNPLADTGDSTVIVFADEPLDVSAANNFLEDVTVFENDGLVTFFEPLAVMAVVTDVTCFGGNDGSILLDVSGLNGIYSYNWNTGDTVSELNDLSAGTYEFTLTDLPSGVELSNSITILSPDSIEIDLTDLTVEGDTLGSIGIEVSGGVSPYTYAWNPSDINEDLTGLENGVYIVTVIDEFGCTASDSIEINIEISSSLAEIEEREFSIYPNPSRGILNIEWETTRQAKNTQWSLFNTLGQLSKSGSSADRKVISLDLLENTPGTYYLLIEDKSIPIILIE